MATVTYSNEDINRFWLQIMGDNALILLNSLSPVEAENVRQAEELAKQFDALALRANQSPTANQTAQLNKEAFQATQDLRKFILQIAKKFLTKVFYLDLKPSVVNYFVDETERYLDHLYTFMQNRQPPFNLIQDEIFWLRIFTQQADYIADNVGAYQKKTRERALDMADSLNEYWAFSVELQGFSRIGKETFSIALDHHVAVVNLLREYYEFLTSLIDLQQLMVKIAGSLSLLYLDRSRRMVCLFLRQAAQYSSTELPDCDPYAKRISNL
jgi:Protein of unknown function (DUF2935).